ncbi:MULTISPECIES: sporulation protein YunB [Anaerotruncus]|uniref:Sporulation protein YunB n=2 Tax=Anaerotruncus TaxID=244127 RepID=A0A498CYH6_9FIRM|nr:sporulation protein YunB [Anaerotruncus massiliensis (ex Liu et al. 2021)]MBC3937573.1 sporulation protein YunB [Anaerotruncus massiliensis (ex Togo et al. 2019)]MCQ4894388.1 sporulation protein YunB [Anaerotruncus sp. DFI.9.16]RLL14683.1 sporulation protein YunB [Anaerotruncus massiliensis (ex Liu et al. 2021)]
MKPITIRISRRKLRALKMLAAGMLILLAAFWVDGRIRPLISTVSTYQSKLVATRAVNDAVLRVISEENITYGKVMNAVLDEKGKVTTVTTNMVALNRLKAEINNAVSDELQKGIDQPIDLPLGTLLGGHFLSGRGPNVQFKVVPMGYTETQIYNKFQSAGINQTLHQVMVTVNTRVAAILPLYTVETDVSTDICIAETVIVGEVPQSFTDISGDNRGLIDKVNDYGLKNVD